MVERRGANLHKRCDSVVILLPSSLFVLSMLFAGAMVSSMALVLGHIFTFFASACPQEHPHHLLLRQLALLSQLQLANATGVS